MNTFSLYFEIKIISHAIVSTYLIYNENQQLYVCIFFLHFCNTNEIIHEWTEIPFFLGI